MRSANHLTRLLLVAALLPVVAVRSSAQGVSPRLILEFGISRLQFNGSDSAVARIHPGFGFDLTAVIPTQEFISLAGGIEYTKHTTDDAADKMGVLMLYIEPRATMKQRGRYTPYAWLRLGYVHTTQPLFLIDDTGFESAGNAVQTGPQIGGGLAVQVQATQHISGFVSGGIQRMSLGDIDFDFDHVNGSSLKATTVVFRVGASFDFAPVGSAIRARLTR